ncbi:hypothetical protein HMPREF1371_01854, partial [Enterococcus faecium P1137]
SCCKAIFEGQKGGKNAFTFDISQIEHSVYFMSVLLIYSCFEGVRYIIEYSGFVYVHYTEKLLVSKKSVVNHCYQTEKEPLVFKGSFFLACNLNTLIQFFL